MNNITKPENEKIDTNLDKKPLGFFDWLNKTFSKPYLIFIFWWIVINIDFVLILIGQKDILKDVKTEYGGILKDSINIIFKNSPIYYMLIFSFVAPFIGTITTIFGVTLLINLIRVFWIFIESRFTEKIEYINHISTNRQEKQKYLISKKHEEQIQKLPKILASYENIKNINYEITNLFQGKYLTITQLTKKDEKTGEEKDFIHFETRIDNIYNDIEEIKLHKRFNLPSSLIGKYFYLEKDIKNSLENIHKHTQELNPYNLEKTKQEILKELSNNLSILEKLKICFLKYEKYYIFYLFIKLNKKIIRFLLLVIFTILYYFYITKT